MAAVATDLAVELREDRPGLLARAAESIASGGLNLDGFAEVEGRLHILTRDPAVGAPGSRDGGMRVCAEVESRGRADGGPPGGRGADFPHARRGRDGRCTTPTSPPAIAS